MAGIWSINDVYNANSKKLTSKLSFDIGEVITARIIKMDKDGTEMILKMLDGWQFPAELKEPLDNLPEGLIKFQVDGNDEGKLILKMLNIPTDKSGTEDSIINILKDQNLSLKDNYKLLKEMVNHDIPLTKENITEVKTVDDFISKIVEKPEEENAFISKYIQSKNIEPESEQGNMVKVELGKFFQQIKGTSTDKLLTLFENNIDVNTDNIKSFNKVFLKEGTVYSELKDISSAMTQASKNVTILNSNKDTPTLSDRDITEIKDYTDLAKKILTDTGNKDTIINDFIKAKGIDTESSAGIQIKNDMEQISKEFQTAFNGIKPNVENSDELKAYTNVAKKISIAIENKDAIIEKFISDKGVDSQSPEGVHIKDEIEHTLSELYTASKDIKANNRGNELKTFIETKNGEDKMTKELPTENKQKSQQNLKIINSVLPQDVKEEVKQKIEMMKEVIKNVMDKSNEGKTEDLAKAMPFIKETINDFKVFNSISNQYYYMDIPLNLTDNQYQCKLIIKDDRKKGKKIDTQNVKLALCLNTKNIEVVDAYISIKNSVMNVDIKCKDNYVKLIGIGKDKLVKDLSDMGYSVHVTVDKKIKDMDIVNSRDFFQDNTISSLDVKV